MTKKSEIFIIPEMDGLDVKIAIGRAAEEYELTPGATVILLTEQGQFTASQLANLEWGALSRTPKLLKEQALAAFREREELIQNDERRTHDKRRLQEFRERYLMRTLPPY